MQGPILNDTSPQSKLAPVLLDRVKNVLLRDPLYVERLKRHYTMFRKAVDQEHQQQPEPTQPIRRRKISRNAPCPCGSGKKYKMCCGRAA
jgi:preprotein translocase subunit SecA